MLGRLRIAVSVFFVLVAVAIAALWARSYWQRDLLDRTSTRDMYTLLASNWGYVYLMCIDGSATPEVRPHGWRHAASPANRKPARFEWIDTPELFQLTVPDWFLLVAAAALAQWSWSGPRFRLRTLLLAFARVAVALGRTIWANG